MGKVGFDYVALVCCLGAVGARPHASLVLLAYVGGALLGLRDTGIPNKRLRQLGEDLQPGQAILCVLVDAAAVARTREALQRYGTTFEVELSSGTAP